MKKTTKNLLISSLILFCTGLLLTLCASLYAKINKIDVYDVTEKARTIENKTVKIDEILKKSPESNYVKQLSTAKFNKINVTSFTGKVVICTGSKDTEVKLDKANTNNIAYSVIGDTLTVTEVDAVGVMGFYIDKGGISFKGLRHIFNPGNSTNSEKTITIKVPANLLLSHVEVSSTIGNVTIDGISAEEINVQAKSGTINIKNLKYQNAKLKINGTFADIHMKNNLYSTCSISVYLGNIDTHLLKNTNTSTILDLYFGDIKVKTDSPTNYYKLSITTNSGIVSRNGKEIGKKLNDDGDGAARISSSIFIGDFQLDYSKGKDPQPPKKPAQVTPPVSEITPPADATPVQGTV